MLNILKQKDLGIEHVLDLHSIARFKGLHGDDLGAIISRRGDRFIVRFGFVWEGVKSDINGEEAVASIEAQRQFCKEMPGFPETLKIECSFFNDTENDRQELKRLYEKCSSKIKPFIASKMAKLDEISSDNNKNGARIRKPCKIITWASYSVKLEELDLKISEKVLMFAEDSIKRLSGEKAIDKQAEYNKFLLNAYKEGFQAWVRAFKKLPGEIIPLTSQEVWQECWTPQNRFSNKQVKDIPNIPHLTVVNMHEKTVDEVLEGKLNIKSVLSFGNFSKPVESSDSIYVDGRHVTALSLVSEPADEPDGYTHDYQLNFLGELLQKPFMHDTRVVVEFGKDQQRQAEKDVINARQEALARAKEKDLGGKRDIAAEQAAEDLILAELSMGREEVHMLVGMNIFVYRKTSQKSRTDAEEISNYFNYPASCPIELQVTLKYWVASLPWSIGPVMGDRFSKRLKTKSGWLPTYIPASISISKAKSGASMFLAHYGKNPLYMNQELQDRRGHSILLGRPGSGKSMLAGSLIIDGMAEGRDCTIIDTPTSKDASTFKPLAHAMACPYIDPFDPENAWNYFEPPYIAPDDPDRVELFQDFKSSVFNILYAMVMGDPSTKFDGVVSARYMAILSAGIKSFFDSREIQLLYEKAKKHGMGSKEWEEIPTLATFEKYLSSAKLALTTVAEKEALASVKASLKSWIDGEYGAVLSSPSRVQMRNKQLVVIALRGIKNKAAAVVWSAITDSIVTTRSMMARKRGSIAFFDELGVKLEYPAFADFYKQLLAISRKNNCYVMGATQTPGLLDPQLGNQVGNDILGNMKFKFIGSIEPGALDSYARICALDKDHIEPLVTEGFRPNYKDKVTSWMIAESNYVNFVDLYISDLLAALIANEEHERKAREEIIGGLPPDKVLAALYLEIHKRKKETHEEENDQEDNKTSDRASKYQLV